MIITRDLGYRNKLLDEQRARMGIGQRRSGLHVSDLVFCSRKAWAERVQEFVQEIDDNTVLTFLRGLSHEDLMAEPVNQVRSAYCFPCQRNWAMDPRIAKTNCCPVCGEILLIGTIDWVEIRDQEYAPVEMKSTLKSARKDLVADMPWYLDQLKSYLFMHGQTFGRVCVLHIMGDYSRQSSDERGAGPRAELVAYRCEWITESEREEWGKVLERRKTAVLGDDKPALGADSPAHDYICSYCLVGEMLPDSTECERFPWVKQLDGRYLRKGSKTIQRSSIEDMMSELSKIKEKFSGAATEPIDARGVVVRGNLSTGSIDGRGTPVPSNFDDPDSDNFNDPDETYYGV